MNGVNDFEDIRPYDNSEVSRITEELINDESFRKAAEHVLGGIPFETIAQSMRSCKTVREVQERICYPIVINAMKQCSTGITLDISSVEDTSKAYVYISNHRDIVLDSSLLSIKLVEKGLDTVEIAIGNNLLIYPWISKFVRLNKAFIVKRNLQVREQFAASMQLSGYIHHAINDKKQSIWIAQREGRAKDSSDETQDSVLKMLAMGSKKTTKESLKELNILPLTISYEYDPCDYLKAKEMQLKRDNPNYHKVQEDDLQNMATGIQGQKGEIYFKTGKCINGFIDTLPEDMSKHEMFSRIASHIDREIHSNYKLFPGNYIAYDLYNNTQDYADRYTDEQKNHFILYIQGQIDKIDIPNKDIPFLRSHILEMYMNPLINYNKTK